MQCNAVSMKSCIRWRVCPQCVSRSQVVWGRNTIPRLRLRSVTTHRSTRGSPAVCADAAATVKKPRARKAAAAPKPPLPSVRSMAQYPGCLFGHH